MTEATFTQRHNAKRAALKLIAAGSAPATEFEIQGPHPQDGRFAILWQTAAAEAPAAEPAPTEAVESEIEAAAGAEAKPEPGAEPAEAEPEPAPAAAIEPAGEPADPALAMIEAERLEAELVRRGYRQSYLRRARPKIGRAARQPRAPRAPGERRRNSKTAALDAAAARGVMPEKPDVTSHANHHYQKRFDRLAELAAAEDWQGVADYQCNGVNTYAKAVRQYRDRLLAAHRAQGAL